MFVYDVKLVHCSKLVSALVDDAELVLTSCAILCIISSLYIVPLLDDIQLVRVCTLCQACTLCWCIDDDVGL